MWRTLALIILLGCSKSSATKHEDRNEPQSSPSRLTLKITGAGSAATWTDASFAAVPKIAGRANDGNARDTWSLRDLVHANATLTARVTAVIGDRRVEIDAAAWADPAHTPILHVTRRGTLKFRYADATGTWGETLVNDVSALELAP